MRVISRFTMVVWAVLLVWSLGLEPVWAQPHVVDVPHGIGSVTTPMTLPVDGVSNPQHTYLKICTDADFTPRFKVYPAVGGAMFNALVPPKSLEPIWVNLEGELFAIGDVRLSQAEDSATHVYTLDIAHYNNWEDNSAQDNWLLEISHEDGQPHRFYFTIGHTSGVVAPNTTLLLPMYSPFLVWFDPLSSIEFVWIPKGCFQMGCVSGECGFGETPVHEECLDGFWMGRTEVTQAQWKKIMGENNNPSAVKDDTHPVEQVSWNKVVEFLDILNEQDQPGGAGKKSYRLPTEDEWEYAARAGTQTAYSFGNSTHILDQYDWYEKNSNGTTHPVGQLKPNAWGLYDMHGNVSEWCGNYYYNYQNPSSPSIGSRTYRGGSFRNDAKGCRVASRQHLRPQKSSTDLGFRLVRTSE